MVLKGLDRISGLDSLNRRIYKDDTGWHFEIFKVPAGVSYSDGSAFKRIPELVVVDLAKENDLQSADEVRAAYDFFMELFYNGRLDVRQNGLESVCREVDTRELVLSLSSYQIEMLQQGLWSIGADYAGSKWDRKDNPEFFELLDMLHLTEHEKRHMQEVVNERRQE